MTTTKSSATPLTKAEEVIVCKDVQKWYGDFHALRGISLTVKKGK